MEEKEGIALSDIVWILKKNVFLILISTFIATFLGAGFVFFGLKPQYQSRGSVIIDTSERMLQKETSEDIIMDGLKYVATIRDYFYEDRFLEGVVEELIHQNVYTDSYIQELKEQKEFFDLLNTYKEKLTVENSANSLVLQLYYTDTNGEFAQIMMESILVRITSVDSTEYEFLSGIVKRSSSATEYYEISNGRMGYILIAAILGLSIGILLSVTKEFLHSVIYKSEEIEKIVELKVLGVIPAFDIRKKKYEKER